MKKLSLHSMKYTLLLFLSFFFTNAFGQQVLESSDAISDCTGATNLLKIGEYRMQFSGKGGKTNDFQAYPSLSNIEEKNTLFCSFKASFNGRFTLHATCPEPIQMIIFEGETKYPCEEIAKGSAEIRRIIAKPTTELGWDWWCLRIPFTQLIWLPEKKSSFVLLVHQK
ncbi:hypothetical protein [Fluviicola sp.]|uniref:hypothetical protein n=1 Tax=Fluviicola sp. TaxID=1917219 RepID=UPI003D2E0A1B